MGASMASEKTEEEAEKPATKIAKIAIGNASDPTPKSESPADSE